MSKLGHIKFAGVALAAVISMMTAGCSAYVADAPSTLLSFSVSMDPTIIVKSDPLTPEIVADRCVMEIFYNGESLGQFESPMVSGFATLQAEVVSGRSYDIAFWADKTGSYSTSSLKNVCIPATGYDVADNSMDAFCAVCKNVATGQSAEIRSVTLKRCLAKICVSPSPTTVTLSAPSSYNILENELGTTSVYTYTNPSFYLFASETESSIDLTVGTVDCTNVPIRRNYITNITINN